MLRVDIRYRVYLIRSLELLYKEYVMALSHPKALKCIYVPFHKLLLTKTPLRDGSEEIIEPTIQQFKHVTSLITWWRGRQLSLQHIII